MQVKGSYILLGLRKWEEIKEILDKIDSKDLDEDNIRLEWWQHKSFHWP